MDTIKKVAECLLSGGVALIPTDTVYGLAVLPSDENATDKIYKLKQRPNNMKLPVMVADIKDIEKLGVFINQNSLKILNSDLVPGAITLVFGFSSGKRPFWLNLREEVAIRIPDDKQLLEILKITGPLFVTSANKHGITGTYNNVKEILTELNGEPDIIVDNGIKNEIPSTIINCRLNPPVIEREGAVSKEKIFKILYNE